MTLNELLEKLTTEFTWEKGLEDGDFDKIKKAATTHTSSLKSNKNLLLFSAFAAFNPNNPLSEDLIIQLKASLTPCWPSLHTNYRDTPIAIYRTVLILAVWEVALEHENVAAALYLALTYPFNYLRNSEESQLRAELILSLKMSYKSLSSNMWRNPSVTSKVHTNYKLDQEENPDAYTEEDENLSDLRNEVVELEKSTLIENSITKRSLDLLWWLQVKYSQELKASYRSLPRYAAAIQMANDLAYLVTKPAPPETEAVLLEALFSIFPSEPESPTTSTISDILAEVNGKVGVYFNANSAPFLITDILKVDAYSEAEINKVTGLSPDTIIEPSDLALWVFRTVQALDLIRNDR